MDIISKKLILITIGTYRDSSDGLTERISFFFYTGTLLQPIKIAKSHLKGATDFINFIETTKVKKPNVSCFGPRNA